jgi:hypothetical protein
MSLSKLRYWLTASQTLCSINYLFKELFKDGLPSLFHGQSDSYYKDVLGGNFEPPPQSLQQIGDRLPADYDEVDAGDGVGPVDAVAVVTTPEEYAVFITEFDDLIVEMEQQDEDMPRIDDAPGPGPDPVPPVPPPPPPPPPAPHDPDDLANDILTHGVWGSFRINAVGAETKYGGEHGAFRARCPFHKASKRTGCAKYIPIGGDTWGHRYERFYKCS